MTHVLTKPAAGPAGDAHTPPFAGDIVCLSHLRWDHVFQRPQHLMTRMAQHRQVLFFEEPEFAAAADRPHLATTRVDGSILRVVPTLPAHFTTAERRAALATLLSGAVAAAGLRDYAVWYYTPMALGLAQALHPVLSVFDVMDELSAFAFAPAELKSLETQLLAQADVVFTGGRSLYEAKRDRHADVHLFPSSIDAKHFARARQRPAEPADQAAVAGPKVGYFGVIDERLDYPLVAAVAALLPQYQFVFLGPVCKVDPAHLPQAANIHYLGQKAYAQLPDYVAHWDVALMPFARNEATRYISPTKTPEYLAAGLPVVSTPVLDVVRTYGPADVIHIAERPADFAQAVTQAATQRHDPAWQARVDAVLAGNSWDNTCARMLTRMQQALRRKPTSQTASTNHQTNPLQ